MFLAEPNSPGFCHVRLSLTLVLLFKTSKIINDMAKVQIKSEKMTLLEENFT